MAGNKISEFTEAEFTAFVSKIIAADFPTDKENDDAIYSFAQLTEQWRTANGKPGFKKA